MDEQGEVVRLVVGNKTDLLVQYDDNEEDNQQMVAKCRRRQVPTASGLQLAQVQYDCPGTKVAKFSLYTHTQSSINTSIPVWSRLFLSDSHMNILVMPH